MIKRFLFALCLALPMLAGAQTVKIGVIDVQAVFTALPEYKTAQTQVAEFAKAYEDQLAKMAADIEQKAKEYEALPANEPQSIKERKAKELEDLYARAQSIRQEAQQAIDRKQMELVQPIRQKVIDAIESVAKEQGFTVVQEKDMFLFFAAPAVDITPAVKARLGLK